MVILCIHRWHLSHRSPPPSSDVDTAFVSVSDIEAAFVLVSDVEAAFVCSNKLQLGQFVYVTYIDIANPLPLVLGLNPLPRYRPYIGNPTLLLQPPFPHNTTHSLSLLLNLKPFLIANERNHSEALAQKDQAREAH
ncbi:hypothetical protein Fmac_011150 [Flemingia macrophylla]|uniref:DUF936 domain-containing protein n=1 Tax=Flemingia macrophylla TaxID=520843 RepID=A0ABD1MLM3_9FABA